LLGLVKPVNFVDKEHRSDATFTQARPRPSNCVTKVFYAARHCRDSFNLKARRFGQDVRKRGLSGPRWPPQHHRRQRLGLNEVPEWPIDANEVVLANYFIKGSRSQLLGKRSDLP
jgi:hypothetical protein